MNLFPIRYYAHDNDHFVQSVKLAEMVWKRIRPQGMSWYCADMDILDPTSIKIYVYSVQDSFRGGIGERIHEEVITEFTPDEKELLDKNVLNIYQAEATSVLEAREETARQEKILQIRKEMFGV